jgi:P-type Ca2+ transporter type 2C
LHEKKRNTDTTLSTVPAKPRVAAWASEPLQKVLQQLGTDPAQGLSSKEAESRIKTMGENRVVEEKQGGFFSVLREEVTEPMILLLLVVGLIYSLTGSLSDAATILVIIVILVLVEVYNEYRAKVSIQALRRLASPTAVVIRDGTAKELSAVGIVPGDLIPLRVGQRIPADGRLLRSYGLQVDESTITGESLSVLKDAEATLPREVTTADLTNSVLAGTLITQGEGLAVGVATGRSTELGRVTALAKGVKFQRTPLQMAMRELAGVLVYIALAFSILIPILGYLRGSSASLSTLILTGLSLAFVTIPEELPIITTMSLAIGALALSNKHALVKRLNAAETLGSVTVIAADKTGTITENRMKVGHLFSDGVMSESPTEMKGLLEMGILASSPTIGLETEDGIGVNPMEAAILKVAQSAGIKPEVLRTEYKLQDEFSFDNKLKIASYLYEHDHILLLVTTGAPEVVIDRSTKIVSGKKEKPLTQEEKDGATSVLAQVSGVGERAVAIAYRKLRSAKKSREELEQDLVFQGIISFVDPPRDGVAEVIATCKKGGIRTVMLTGDHPDTARAIAGQVGIENVRLVTGSEIASMSDDELKIVLSTAAVYARISPEDKLRIVRLLRELSDIVAVTGDGVNDAPALREADIGIALGLRGTDAAKEAAGMILTDDNFVTIGEAVRAGRRIFANIKKGIRYYLAVKLALVGIFLLPIILGLPFPFPPIQIILLELFMDLAASSGFVAEGEEADVMMRPPRNPKERFLTRGLLVSVFVSALGLFTAVSVAYLYTYYSTGNLLHAQTVAFAAWILTHIFLAFNLRSETEPLAKLGFFSNRVMVGWGVAAMATLAAAITVPAVQSALKTSTLTLFDVGFVLIVSIAATFWLDIPKWRHMSAANPN